MAGTQRASRPSLLPIGGSDFGAVRHPVAGGQDDSVQRNPYLACTGRAGCRGDATHGERRTTALDDPEREVPPGDYGGAMATSGSHRAQPFGGWGRCERRRTKRDPGERCQGAEARATPCVAGVPPIGGTHRPQDRSTSIRKSPGQMVGAFLRIIGNGRYLPAFFCDSFYTSCRSYMVDRLRAV